MAVQTIEYLKSRFETGDIPTQQDFIDLFDSFLHLRGGSIGDGTNKTTFEPNGTMVAYGEATTWNDINTSLIPGIGSGGAAPAIIAINGDPRLDCYAFSGTNPTPDEWHGSFEILHDYKEGSDIIPHIHWAATNANVGNIKWQLRYMWVDRGGIYTAGLTTDITVSTSGVAWEERHTAFPAITGSGHTIGSRFIFCLFRDATDVADTYDANAAVFDFGVHYEKDTLGSREITAK